VRRQSVFRSLNVVRESQHVMPLLDLARITKAYGRSLALDATSFAVEPGQFVSLLGPSGCGKSTLLRMVAGLDAPSTGKIQAPVGSQVAFVFQEPALLPWRTVADNVQLPLELRGTPKAAAKPLVDEALTLVGLQDFAGAYPRTLSGGMRMRVSLARALASKPALLLMDEPFAALDELSRQKLNDELLRIQAAASATVLFVTHNVFEAVYLSSRILVLSARPGRIIADIAVTENYPRSAAYRSSQGFGAKVAEVSHALEG
jgi:NitT/TauT family transport system ATP-binding protein